MFRQYQHLLKLYSHKLYVEKAPLQISKSPVKSHTKWRQWLLSFSESLNMLAINPESLKLLLCQHLLCWFTVWLKWRILMVDSNNIFLQGFTKTGEEDNIRKIMDGEDDIRQNNGWRTGAWQPLHLLICHASATQRFSVASGPYLYLQNLYLTNSNQNR